MVQGTHRVLRLHLGCRRPSVARNPRKCSTSEGGTALRRRRCWLAPPSPPPPPPPPPPPQGGLSLNPWRWRQEDGSRVGARVEAGRTRTARTAASRPNRTMRSWRLPKPVVGREGRANRGTLILVIFGDACRHFSLTLPISLIILMAYQVTYHTCVTYVTYVTYNVHVLLMLLII